MQVSSANSDSLSKIPMSLNLSASSRAGDQKVEAVERREKPEEEFGAGGAEDYLLSPGIDPALEGKLDKLRMVQYAFGKALSINKVFEDEMLLEPVL
jgi:hypothetical protein